MLPVQELLKFHGYPWVHAVGRASKSNMAAAVTIDKDTRGFGSKRKLTFSPLTQI